MPSTYILPHPDLRPHFTCQPANHPSSHSSNHQASQPPIQPASHPAKLPSSQPASLHPASQPASQPSGAGLNMVNIVFGPQLSPWGASSATACPTSNSKHVNHQNPSQNHVNHPAIQPVTIAPTSKPSSAGLIMVLYRARSFLFWGATGCHNPPDLEAHKSLNSHSNQRKSDKSSKSMQIYVNPPKSN